MTGETGLSQAFFDAFPDEFCRNLIRLLAQVYKTANDKCKAEYPHSEAHDLRPHVRRAELERDVRDLTTRYGEIEARPELNPRGTSFYTLISCNQVVLTLSAVAHPSVLVRRAMFRETYAQSSQLNLYKRNLEPPPGAKVYALLLHGPARKDPSRPGFMHIAFPDKKLRKYLFSIDLFAKYATLVNDLWPTHPILPQSVDPQVQPREDAMKKADELRRQLADDRSRKDQTG